MKVFFLIISKPRQGQSKKYFLPDRCLLMTYPMLTHSFA